MKLLIASIVIFIIVTIALIATVIVIKKYEQGVLKPKNGTYVVKKPIKWYKVVPFSLLSFLILLFGMFTTIPANSVGIIYDELNGGVQDETYGEGFQTKSIFEHITTISTANRSAVITTTGQTNDGQYATVQLSLIYKIEKHNAGKFYRITNGDDIPEKALETIVKSSLQSSTIKYNIFELLSFELENARLDFKDDLAKALMSTYYITLVDVSFDDLDGGEEVEQILQKAAKAQQEIDIAKLAAQANLISANNEAEVKKILADATAYAITSEGNAHGEAANAYANNIVKMIDNLYTNMQGTITYEQASSLVLNIIFYNTWNGELPEVLTSDSLSSMIGALISVKGEGEASKNDSPVEGTTQNNS